jgi:hypothetical protein
MKKLILSTLTVLLLSTFSSTQVLAASNPRTTTSAPVESAEVKALLNRLNEIRDMDKSTLSRTEKKVLRNEVQSTKEALRDHGHGGLYISGGAVIIIVLLIILL